MPHIEKHDFFGGNIPFAQPFFSLQLMSDNITAAVAARNYFPIPVTAAVAVRKDRK